MSELRTKQIIIRLTHDEHEQLLAKKTTTHLAKWIRQTCLEQQVQQKIVHVADPELLRQVAKIGTNLNQIAKRLNIDAKDFFEVDDIYDFFDESNLAELKNEFGLVQVKLELTRIREQLENLLIVSIGDDC